MFGSFDSSSPWLPLGGAGGGTGLRQDVIEVRPYALSYLYETGIQSTMATETGNKARNLQGQREALPM